jgi:hypothetical protein
MRTEELRESLLPLGKGLFYLQIDNTLNDKNNA